MGAGHLGRREAETDAFECEWGYSNVASSATDPPSSLLHALGFWLSYLLATATGHSSVHVYAWAVLWVCRPSPAAFAAWEAGDPPPRGGVTHLRYLAVYAYLAIRGRGPRVSRRIPVFVAKVVFGSFCSVWVIAFASLDFLVRCFGFTLGICALRWEVSRVSGGAGSARARVRVIWRGGLMRAWFGCPGGRRPRGGPIPTEIE